MNKSVFFIISPIHFQYVGARIKGASDAHLLHSSYRQIHFGVRKNGWFNIEEASSQI
jgi:hypothetical protein